MRKYILQVVVILSLFVFVSDSVAAWQQPEVAMTAEWGSATGQVKKEYSDSGDIVPMGFCVTKSGYVAIGDDLNARIQIYKPDGNLHSTFGAISIPDNDWTERWPLNMRCFSDGVYSGFEQYRQVYELDGKLRRHWENLSGGLIGIQPDDSFIAINKSTYYKYSPQGQLLQTYQTKPLELGEIVSFDSLSEGNYKAAFKYDNVTYGFKISSEVKDFVRDTGGNFNVLFNAGNDAIHYKINKYNRCGKVIASLDLPDDVYDEDTENEFAIESYSKPVITFNSDVYVAKIADNYSILKWTWQDEPNMQSGPEAPPAIRIKPRTSGIIVRWDPSPQDPGCVSGYEISRSDTSGGVFSALQTVESGKTEYKDTSATAGKTYYYKIRAISGSDYSPYSVEISGKR